MKQAEPYHNFKNDDIIFLDDAFKELSLICETGAISSVIFNTDDIHFTTNAHVFNIEDYFTENQMFAVLESYHDSQILGTREWIKWKLLIKVLGTGYMHNCKSNAPFKKTFLENEEILSDTAFYRIIRNHPAFNFNGSFWNSAIPFFKDFFKNNSRYPKSWLPQYQSIVSAFIATSKILDDDKKFGMHVFMKPDTAGLLAAWHTSTTDGELMDVDKMDLLISQHWRSTIEKEKRDRLLKGFSTQNSAMPKTSSAL